MTETRLQLHKEIPRGDHAPHINFPDIFIEGKVDSHLVKLQHVLEHPDAYTDIVLNLEKCRWFDILPLAQLLALLCTRRAPNTRLHVLGPSASILPYHYDYIQSLEKRIEEESLSPEEFGWIQERVRWHTKDLPQLRLRAGAFLIGWGAFDLLEDHCNQCHWYTLREKEVSLGELKETYLFGYGAGAASKSSASDRVWPFMAVYRADQDYMLSRVNGEELIAGALRKYSRNSVIEDGVAANVFFFEPFENVFQHAFLNPLETDMALVSMRVTDWMFSPEGELTNLARWFLSKVPEWQRQFIEHIRSPFMEIVVADCGRGIPDSIFDSMLNDAEFCQTLGITGSGEIGGHKSLAWEAIKYAFEPHSTRKTEPLPGRRGLAWLKEKMAQVGGAVQVVSNGGKYVLADLGGGLTELSNSSDAPKRIVFNKQVIAGDPWLRGTFVHMMFPLKSAPPKRAIQRFPRWRHLLDPQSLFSQPKSVLVPFRIPLELLGKPTADQWESYLKGVKDHLAEEGNRLAVFDLAQQNVTRVALEHLFERLLQIPELHGRVLAINCDRHLVSRLDTVDAIDRMREEGLIFPLFEATLRMHWVGTSPQTEASLLKYFMSGPSGSMQEVEHLTVRNACYFIRSLDSTVDFSFNIEMVESLMRSLLGDTLVTSLVSRQAIHHGRFILPNKKVVTTYVEPHQIFADSDTANLLCSHLSTLLRWRYSRLSVSTAADIRVLTATRIGRDIAMRMPAAFPQKLFVYYDYHLVKPDKPRLVKHLAGRSIVIVVDIISTGSQVNELIQVCEDAGAFVIGIISFIDFISGGGGGNHTFVSRGRQIEHQTFKRLPQTLSDPQPGDIPIDKYTLSISPVPEVEREKPRDGSALLSPNRSLRMLEDCAALHYGHYELFGHHYDFVINMSRLLTLPSPELDEMLRACEAAILKGAEYNHPTAIVLYPDLSDAHILQGSLEKRLAIRRMLGTKLQFVEARRGSRARGRRYWLTQGELDRLRAWAREIYPEGYSVLLLDDGAASGETLLALLDLARELKPERVAAFVLINRMPHLQTYHHSEIERFAWAASNFKCLLHLNLPVFSRDNCPLCQERTELARELRHAKGDWFKRQISHRLNSLDLITSLNPQDVLEGPLTQPLTETAAGPTPEHNLIGKGQTVITRAASLRTAINDGFPIMDIFDEVSGQENDLLWRMTVIELARRVDLQQSQRVERVLRDALVKVIPGQNRKRSISALEALRFMRPEILHPVLKFVVRAALREVPGTRKLAELILLMRRVTSYRHLTSSQAFDEESLIEEELDQAGARARQGSALRSAIDHINYEWRGGPQPRLDLVSVIKELEKILQTHRRLSHQLLYELSQYIGDQREVFDPKVSSALNSAVRAANLSRMLVRLLADAHKLCDESLHAAIERAYSDARRLRMQVLSHMQGTEASSFRELRDIMERVQQDLCGTVGHELGGQFVDPAEYVGSTVAGFKASPPAELLRSELLIEFANHLPPSTLIIIDSALFQNIISNLMSNLRHAVEPGSQQVRASVSLDYKEGLPGPEVSLRVKCATRAPVNSDPDEHGTMSAELSQSAEAYGVERFVPEECRLSPKVPWDETWRFWRL